MDKPMPNLAFRFMSLAFKVRDFLLPRKDVLNEVGIKPGFHILDYGCGPGSYSVIAASLVGSKGKVYALDIHPLAIRRVQERAAKKGLTNIHTISSDRLTGLKDATIDVVLLYDTFHHLRDSDAILAELHRVLKPDGFLSFSDHHMKDDNILSQVTHKGLFKLSKKGRKTYCFLKGKG